MISFKKLISNCTLMYKSKLIRMAMPKGSQNVHNRKIRADRRGFHHSFHFFKKAKITLTVLHSVDPNGNRIFKHRDVDVVPNIQSGGELSHLLCNFHIFGKNRTEDSVYFLPLLVVCQAYEEFRAATNPSDRASLYRWTNFCGDLIECGSLGFQCSLNQSEGRAKRSLVSSFKKLWLVSHEHSGIQS